MIPSAFEYSTPQTLAEAISLIDQLGDEGKILSGGHSLIPMMKLRLASPAHIVDINQLPDLDYIREEDGWLKIGGLVRETDLEESELIISRFPIIIDATKLIADPQVRNLATLAGNLAHGDAANDHPAVMLALNAQVVATGPSGARTIPMTEFFYGFYMTALQPNEILTEIQIPLPKGNAGGAYHKLERKVGDYATVGVGVQLSMDERGNCVSAGIGLTNVGMTPIKATRSEGLLIGAPVSDDVIAQAAQAASEDCSPSADLRGSEAYKRDMVRVITGRMIKKALERTHGPR